MATASVAHNAVNSLDRYRMLAEAGDINAVFQLAQAYRFGTHGLAVDYAQALEYFRLGLKHSPNRKDLRTGIYQMHQGEGEAVAAARKQAEATLLRDAEMNHDADAYYALYLINWKAPKIRQIYQAKAAELGHVMAAYHAAHHYRYGWSVKSDLIKAIYFYEIAAKKGHRHSMDALKELSTDPKVVDYYSQEDISRFANYSEVHLSQSNAAAVANMKLAKEAYDLGDEAQAIEILNEGLANWRKRSDDFKYTSRIWWEGQTQAGRYELEWSLFLYKWLCVTYNASDRHTYTRIGAAVHVAERYVSLGRYGMMRQVCGDLKKHMHEQDGIDVDAYSQAVRFNDDYSLFTSNPLPVHIKYDAVTHRKDLLSKDDLISANTMSAVKYLAQERLAVGDWESALLYADWMHRWIQYIEVSGQKPKRTFPGYHFVVDESAYFIRASVFAGLGLIEEEAQVYELVLKKKYRDSQSRGCLESKYKLAALRVKQGRFDEIDLEDLAENEATIKANQYFESHQWQFSKLVRARVIAAREDFTTGLALVDEVLTATTEQTLPLLRLEALLTACDLSMDQNNYTPVQTWLMEALTWARSQGLLLEELRVYECYVHYLMATGDYQLALEMQQRILELITALNLSPRETEAWRQLAQIYVLLNDRESALAVVDRVGRSLFEPKWLALLEASDSSAPTVAADWGLIGLQPLRMVSAPIVSDGQTIFTISNPTPQSANLQVQIESERFSIVDATSSDDYIAFKLSNAISDKPRGTKLSYTLLADSQVPILISASGVDQLLEDTEIQLSVYTVNQKLESHWLMQAYAGATDVAIVDAAHLIDNPFYLVPVYHQLSAKDLGATTVALRAIASEPTRIEAYAIDGSLIFVDAEGNGSLADSGDLIGGTNMHGLYPTLEWKGSDIPIEFRYQPLHRKSGEHVEIQIETCNDKDSTDWTTNVIDWLEIGDK